MPCFHDTLGDIGEVAAVSQSKSTYMDLSYMICSIATGFWHIWISDMESLALTDVVFTPHSSNFSNVGGGALGVSINSNSLSEPLTLWGLEAMIAVFSIESRRRRLDLLMATESCCLKS